VGRHPAAAGMVGGLVWGIPPGWSFRAQLPVRGGRNTEGVLLALTLPACPFSYTRQAACTSAPHPATRPTTGSSPSPPQITGRLTATGRGMSPPGRDDGPAGEIRSDQARSCSRRTTPGRGSPASGWSRRLAGSRTASCTASRRRRRSGRPWRRRGSASAVTGRSGCSPAPPRGRPAGSGWSRPTPERSRRRRSTPASASAAPTGRSRCRTTPSAFGCWPWPRTARWSPGARPGTRSRSAGRSDRAGRSLALAP
jgi:hypothetical protein